MGLHELRIDAQSLVRYILPPVAQKNLALHAKYFIIDNDLVFVGSANLDPRPLRLKTETGLIVRDKRLNREIRTDTGEDLSSANAWRLQLSLQGDLFWGGDDTVLKTGAEGSFMRRIENCSLLIHPSRANYAGRTGRAWCARACHPCMAHCGIGDATQHPMQSIPRTAAEPAMRSIHPLQSGPQKRYAALTCNVLTLMSSKPWYMNSPPIVQFSRKR